MLHSEKTDFRIELNRQAIHFVVGCLCILAFILLGKMLTALLLLLLLVIGYWVMLQIKHKGSFKLLREIIKHVERPNEEHFPALPAFMFLIGALLAILLFPNPLAGLAALIVVTFGDSIATLIGKYYGKIEMITNRTLEGTVVGILIAFIPLAFLFQLEIAFAIAAVGMLAEYLPIEDNIGIPIVAGLTATLLL